MAELSTALVGMFNNSLQTSMSEIAPAQEWTFTHSEQVTDPTLPESVFLTMSSHLFRIFVSINFARETVSEVVAKGLGVKIDTLNRQSTDDYLLELGNSVCGVFKRDLGKHIPALGMSTPNLLRRESFSYMDSFHITSQHFQWIKYNSQPVFLAGYYFCPYTEDDIEIIEQHTSAQADAGELELF